ncbi:MAG: Smr/MutS family protein [Tenericutes bacterium]|jgi:dsDNA-specific endonuclease/ATPase MutS2|nr:Smr/MutS family protein [Bacilli bacterium]MDD3995757.1 Smr/MutS family protein [Bacilli bacterium]MDD4624581.1 Smr/MutS family protein [Bacilli bacterium]MDD4831552.1 Smr/MutS family protein [Bacilli bacterium]NLV90695.1 Smr/MutS family protein [Mycoplasmatota bacterium]
MFNDLITTKNIPKIDLHGETSDISVIYLKKFILENYKLKVKYFVVIHGIGKDIIRKAIYEELNINKFVEEYKMDMYNPGCTIVKLKLL